MSLVGPRPLVPHEDALVTRLWRERHEHRPGLTGLWQLRRSRPTTIDELISLDRGYLANWSPWVDVLIVAGTVRAVLRQAGR
jgi:lipopolysaccharide/colanic/teichoic acid biosynthesis glycosyltransferase